MLVGAIKIIVAPNKIQKVSGDAFGGMEGMAYKSFGECEWQPYGAERVLQLRWGREPRLEQLGW
jgi:hypothetical protein